MENVDCELSGIRLIISNVSATLRYDNATHDVTQDSTKQAQTSEVKCRVFFSFKCLPLKSYHFQTFLVGPPTEIIHLTIDPSTFPLNKKMAQVAPS